LGGVSSTSGSRVPAGAQEQRWLERIDPLILFKMLVLQQLFKLSDEELEFQVNDR
jgi:hypothetical protein